MAESLELQDALLSMKCCLCKNYLSVPPIISISEDGKKLKCGRCEKIEKPLRTRNFAFENIVKFFKFPCIYDDCNEMIPWEDVERHEDICEKKTIRCPIYHKCEDIVQVQNLEEHMRKNHGKFCFSDGYLTAEVELNHSKILSVISNNQQFLVMIRNKSTPEVYVASLNSINECFTYNLKLSSISEDSYSLLIEHQPINKYDDRDHCFECITMSCSLSYHPHSMVNGYKPVTVNYKKIDPTHMKHVFGDISKVKYTIEIHPKKVLEENDNDLANENLTVKSQTNNSTIVDLLRKQLQCPICMEYIMNRNIYKCEIGHVVCDVCKTQLAKCPACHTKIGESRIYLADEIVFTCSFFENGCGFTGKLKLLPQHEENCDRKH